MIYVWFHTCTRLGNWLSQYAAAISANCGDVKFYTTDSKVRELYGQYKEEIFHGTELVNELPQGIPVYRQEKDFTPIRPPVAGEDFELVGYFQDVRYYDMSLVHELLDPNPARVQAIKGRFADWLNRPHVTGISVRRTDYLKIPHVLPFCGKKYYRDAIARIPECRDFIVCSDDFPWCEKWFVKEFPDKNFLFMMGQPVLDQLYIHSLCKNNILSNSSFAWWSAVLNKTPDKRVIRPSLWNGFAIPKHSDGSNGPYLPGVEVVENHYTVFMLIHGWLVWKWRQFKRRFYPHVRWAVKLMKRVGLKK